MADGDQRLAWPDDSGQPQERRSTLARILKLAWGVVVVAVAGALVVREWEAIDEQIREMSPGLLALGFVLTIAAKLVLAENARVAAVQTGMPIGYETATRVYNLSQLGKYLPGSVWQFVGRAAAYRRLGASYGSIRDAILIESLWVVGGALVAGLSVSGIAVVPVLVDSLEPAQVTWLIIGVGVVSVLSIAALLLRRDAVLRFLRLARPSKRSALVQVAIWTLLGASFWMMARASEIEVSLPYAIGLFAAAYAVGFLVLFVPAGLGVRDAILVVGLLAEATEAQALVVVLVARVWYVAAELLLVAVQAVTPRLTETEWLGDPSSSPPGGHEDRINERS